MLVTVASYDFVYLKLSKILCKATLLVRRQHTFLLLRNHRELAIIQLFQGDVLLSLMTLLFFFNKNCEHYIIIQSLLPQKIL